MLYAPTPGLMPNDIVQNDSFQKSGQPKSVSSSVLDHYSLSNAHYDPSRFSEMITVDRFKVHITALPADLPTAALSVP